MATITKTSTIGPNVTVTFSFNNSTMKLVSVSYDNSSGIVYKYLRIVSVLIGINLTISTNTRSIYNIPVPKRPTYTVTPKGEYYFGDYLITFGV